MGSSRHHDKLSVLIYPNPASFYPGVAGPTLPSIAAGNTSIPESIEAPVGDEYVSRSTAETHEKPTGENRVAASSRGTRVIGSFEHPILPMPPVRCLFRNGGNCVLTGFTAQDNDSRYGFPIVLRYRGERG